MKLSRPRLTYANVVSSLALFLVVAGGSAFAANQLAKNSVGPKQLKKNAVTAAKIKNNAVTTAKIKNEAITGAKIKESSLGPVPNAQNATTATNAVNATNANVAANLNGYQRKFVRATPTTGSGSEAARAAAPEIVLFTAGPLTVYAKCYASGGALYGAYFMKTSVGGVIMDSYYDSFQSGPYMQPGTPESDRELYYTSVGTNSSYYYAEYGHVFGAIAPDGTAIRGDTQIGLKQGNPADGPGPYGPGDVCLFSGEMAQLNG